MLSLMQGSDSIPGNPPQLQRELPRHAVSLALFEELKHYLGLEASDAVALREIYPLVKEHLPGIIEDFYRHILDHVGTRRILQDPNQVERLKKTLHIWLEEVFLSPLDAEYYEKRTRIGLVHVRIGLPQAYVFAAMAHIQSQLEAVLQKERHRGQPARLVKGSSALLKVLNLDLALITGSYHDAEKYRDLVESAPEMIHTVDNEGRFVSVNRTEEERLGYAHDELVSKPLEDLVAPEDRTLLRKHLAEVFRSGESRCEIRLLTSKGERLEVEILATGVRDTLTGEIVRTRAYVRDVTERNRMARTLTEQASLARLGEMAAVVAHEVKNPLAGIGGAIQVIGSHLPPQSPDRGIVREILDRIDSLNGTVQDLLLYARPRLPKLAPVRLLSILQDTTFLLGQDPGLGKTRVRISGEDLSIPADAELLKPVFLNLLINAAQAMGGKGEIRVDVTLGQGRCQISFSDSGPGIPAGIRDRIFEPFFTTKHRGTGLGLPIAKRVVEAHGGRMTVTCPTTGGAVVTVELPFRGASAC